MALLTNGLIRVHDNGQVVVVLVYNDTEIFEKYKTQTGEDNFVMCETTNVNGHVEVHVTDETMTATEFGKKMGHDISRMTITQILMTPIWVCKKIKSLYESVML